MRAEGVCEGKNLNIFDAHLPAMPGPIQCNANANTMPPGQNEYVREFVKNIFDAHLRQGKQVF